MSDDTANIYIRTIGTVLGITLIYYWMRTHPKSFLVMVVGLIIYLFISPIYSKYDEDYSTALTKGVKIEIVQEYEDNVLNPAATVRIINPTNKNFSKIQVDCGRVNFIDYEGIWANSDVTKNFDIQWAADTRDMSVTPCRFVHAREGTPSISKGLNRTPPPIDWSKYKSVQDWHDNHPIEEIQ